MPNLAYFVWDPNPAMFHFSIPILNRPILWYGFLFAFGFFVGYLILTYLLRRYLLSKEGKHLSSHALKLLVRSYAEQLTFYVVIGAIVGSRLGDVLFYQDFLELVRHPLSVIAVWEGGLASHGGAAGMLAAVWLFARRRKIPFWTAVDFTVIPTAIAAVFIRLGNFFNQEILGKPTELPWGILFLHPADGGPIVPRHPAQLYEAACYLISFCVLLWYWHRRPPFQPGGRLTGLFLLLVFGFRFFIEFLKVEQSVYLSSSSLLTMGQWLSVPFILLGCWLFFRKKVH
jgi:phosphatidylglycerol---prolipoprotein diacylglyceryl transferase